MKYLKLAEPTLLFKKINSQVQSRFGFIPFFTEQLNQRWTSSSLKFDLRLQNRNNLTNIGF